jgi:hypothetical protein
MEIDKIMVGGAPLKLLWTGSEARSTIRTGQYDIVVLQEDLPETTVKQFQKYSVKFLELCREYKSRAVFYMTWAYDRLKHVMTEEMIESAHKYVANNWKVDIAAVSVARRSAAAKCPNINLWHSDMEHPSLEGTFLSACCLFNTVFKESEGCEDIAYVPDGMDQEVAESLANIAASVSPPRSNQWIFATEG